MNQEEKSSWKNVSHGIARILNAVNLNHPGVEAFIKHQDGELLRQTVIDLAVESPVEDEFQMFVCIIFDRLGLGTMEKRLREITTDSSKTDRLRYLAFEILLHADCLGDGATGAGIDGPTWVMFHDQRTRLLLRSIFRDPRISKVLATSLNLLDGEENQIANFLAIEELRREENVPAAVAYRNILTDGRSSSLRELALDAMCEEGGIVGRSILQAMRSQKLQPGERQRIQSRLDHWRYPMRSQAGRGELEVLVSACDKDGRIGFFLKSKRDNGRFDEFSFSVHVVEGLEFASSALDVVESIDPHGFGVGDLVDFPSSTAAWMLVEFRKIRLTRGRNHLSEGEPIVARLEKIMSPATSVSLALAEPLGPNEVTELMSENPYSSWKRSLPRKMGLSELKSRFEFMAVWHRFRGESRKAEVAALLSKRPEMLNNMSFGQSCS